MVQKIPLWESIKSPKRKRYLPSSSKPHWDHYPTPGEEKVQWFLNWERIPTHRYVIISLFLLLGGDFSIAYLESKGECFLSFWRIPLENNWTGFNVLSSHHRRLHMYKAIHHTHLCKKSNGINLHHVLYRLLKKKKKL